MNANLHIPSAWLEPTLHSAYLTLFAQFIQLRKQVNIPTPIGDARLLPFVDFVPLLDMIDAETHPEIGIELGLNIPAISHGPLGFVVQSSRDLRHVLEMMSSCNRVRNRLHDFSFVEEQGFVIHRMSKNIELDLYTPFVNLAVIFSLITIVAAIFSPQIISQAQLYLPMKKRPGDFLAHFAIPPKIVWESKYMEIRFPQSIAHTPNLYADTNMLEHNLMAVHAELARLDGNIASKVKFILNKSHPHWANVETVAQELVMSGRTLMRKLKEEQTNFQNLLDEAKDELACWYLSKTNLSLTDIAERIGFSDYSNFTRLFKRLHAMTPHEYRQRSQSQGVSEEDLA